MVQLAFSSENELGKTEEKNCHLYYTVVEPQIISTTEYCCLLL